MFTYLLTYLQYRLTFSEGCNTIGGVWHALQCRRSPCSGCWWRGLSATERATFRSDSVSMFAASLHVLFTFVILILFKPMNAVWVRISSPSSSSSSSSFFFFPSLFSSFLLPLIFSYPFFLPSSSYFFLSFFFFFFLWSSPASLSYGAGLLVQIPPPPPGLSLSLSLLQLLLLLLVHRMGGRGGGPLLTNVINKNCTAGAHDIFQKKKKDTVGHKPIPRNTLLGHMLYFRRKKRLLGK